MRSLYTIAFLYIGVSAYAILAGPALVPPMAMAGTSVADFDGTAGQWFRVAKPYCNTVEAEMIHHLQPQVSRAV